MKEINLQDMARMYKKEYEFLNKELERLENVMDNDDYELTSRDDMILSIAKSLTNPPHTISNSQIAFLWNMDKRSTNRITTDLTTKKLKGKMEPNKKLRPGAFNQDTTADAPHLQEPEDIMESFYRLSGTTAVVNEQSDGDYETARKIADRQENKGPVTSSSASAWAKEAGISIDNIDTVVHLANEILGYEGLDEGKKRNFSIGSLKKKAISLRKRSMDIVDKVYEMDEAEGDHLNELLNDESFMRGVSGNYAMQEVESELDEQGAGAAVAGVPGAAKPGEGYTMVGAGTGGTGPSYGKEELEEKKAPNSGTVAFHFTTEDGIPYFGEADVVVSKDVDDAQGPMTTIDSIRVKSIVDQEGNPVAVTDEMKSAAKQAVEEMEDLDLMVSAGYEDDDYSGDDIDEKAITADTYLAKEAEPQGPRSPKPGSSTISESNEGVMKTLATRKLYKGKGKPEDEDPMKQLQRKDVWIPKEKKSDIIAKFKDRVQTMLKEMQLEEAPATETEVEPTVEPTTRPDKTNEPRNPVRKSPGITPKPKAEESKSTNPDVDLFLKNRGLNRN